MEKSGSSRIAYWDNVKGVLILLVVFSHFLYNLQDYGTINTIVDIIYMFHMPAFVFVSGFFSKSDNAATPRSLFRLGTAYLIFNAVYMLSAVSRGLAANALMPYNSCWYLLALIVWRISARPMAKVRFILPLSVIMALLAGLWTDIDNTLSAARIICFYPYFIAGYKYCGEMPFSRKHKGLADMLSVVAAVGIVILSYGIFSFDNNSLLMCSYAKPTAALERAVLYIAAGSVIFALLRIAPRGNIPLLTMIGRNSMSVYLIHRIVTIYFDKVLPAMPEYAIITISLAAAVVLSALLGNDLVGKAVSHLINSAADNLFSSENTDKSRISKLVAVLAAVLLCSLKLNSADSEQEQIAVDEVNEIYRCMSAEDKAEYDNAFKIVFAGDLILLEDQVRNGYDGESYDFSELFEYTKGYISTADFAIGVFEGPMAGEEAGYSSSNFDDGKELWLNFPDEFAQAVSDAGFDLVTTANNHILDRGTDGAVRTLDVLDETGIEHTGSYRSSEEKDDERVKIIDTQGIRLAVLSYTYGINGTAEELLVDGVYSYLSSYLCDPDSERFGQVYDSVKADFEKARSYSPDLIIVLPHMGTQFALEADDYQLEWCGIFKELGADIILGDHSHSVQPAFIESVDGRKVFTAYSPGNYANIYREYNGDTSMLVEVYIDREDKSIIGGGIVPMWTLSSLDGNYYPAPVYEILTNDALRKSISTYELEKVGDVFELITETALGTRLKLNMAERELHFDENGFVCSPAQAVELTEEMKNGRFYSILSECENVCFIGDSVTEGTKNGGYGWYEPISGYVSGIVTELAQGGGTVQTMIGLAENYDFSNVHLCVIAIGTNDVRYRDESICAMTSAEYTQSIDRLCGIIRESSPDCEIVLIAPWTSTDGDPYCSLTYEDKMQLNREYSDALEIYADEHGYCYIDTAPYIEEYICRYPASDYLLDHIHPDSTNGIRLYAEAVMNY